MKFADVNLLLYAASAYFARFPGLRWTNPLAKT
jgi:hypothetical protein